MRGMRRRQDLGAGHDARLGQAVVDIVGREQAEAGVAVLGVVPGEEDLAMRPGILDRGTLRARQRQCEDDGEP